MPPRSRSPARRARPCRGSRRPPPPRSRSARRRPRPATAADRGGRPPGRPPRGERSARGLGPLVPRGEVAGLLLRELVDLDAHGLELEARDLAVDLRRHRIYLAVELARMLRRVLQRERLIRE